MQTLIVPHVLLPGTVPHGHAQDSSPHPAGSPDCPMLHE